MIYGKIVDGELEYAPVNLRLDSGEMIFNFNQRTDLLSSYGYKEVVFTNSEDESEVGITDNGDKIIVVEQTVSPEDENLNEYEELE